jgi:hypothetical protein
MFSLLRMIYLRWDDNSLLCRLKPFLPCLDRIPQDNLFNLLRIMAYVKMIVLIVYLGHIFGCMFYFFSDDEWLTA